MYTHTVTQISWIGVTKICFLAGTAFGGAGGILLGILDHSMIGILGGAFLGLLVGVVCCLAGAVFASVFNLLAPVFGGIAVRLETLPAEPAAPEAVPAQSEGSAD